MGTALGMAPSQGGSWHVAPTGTILRASTHPPPRHFEEALAGEAHLDSRSPRNQTPAAPWLREGPHPKGGGSGTAGKGTFLPLPGEVVVATDLGSRKRGPHRVTEGPPATGTGSREPPATPRGTEPLHPRARRKRQKGPSASVPCGCPSRGTGRPLHEVGGWARWTLTAVSQGSDPGGVFCPHYDAALPTPQA